jgi:excisionase family DNA binding protein
MLKSQTNCSVEPAVARASPSSQSPHQTDDPGRFTSDDPIMTVEQVAADLSVSRRTLYDWMHKGIIEPPQKLGLRRVGYRRSAIERFKAARPLAFVPRR